MTLIACDKLKCSENDGDGMCTSKVIIINTDCICENFNMLKKKQER